MTEVKCQSCKCRVEPDPDHNCPNCGQPLETAAFEPAPETRAGVPFAAEDPQPGGPDDNASQTQGGGDPSELQIRLEYQHTYCIANQHGSIRLRLANLGASRITELELVAQCAAFASYTPPEPRKVNLAPQTHTQYLPLDFDLASRAGKYTVELKGYYLDENGNPTAFCGMLFLIVRDPSQKGSRAVLKGIHGADLSNLDLDAYDQLLIIDSSGIDGSRDPRQANPRMEQGTPPELWLAVELEEDFERTRSLHAWLEKQKQKIVSPAGTPPLAKTHAKPCRVALITLLEDDEERTVHIWTQPLCRLGRNKPDADLISVRLPADENNGLISRKHCALEVKGNNVYLHDGPSRNGTYVNHQRIEAATPLQTGQVISLARQVDLEFRAFRQLDHCQSVNSAFNTCSSLWDCSRTLARFDLKSAARKAPLECYQLRRKDAFRHKLAYLFIQTSAPLGASTEAAVQLRHASIAPLHGRLILKQQVLFIEDLNAPGGIWVNGRRLQPYAPWPLGDTAEIRIGEQLLRYRQLEP